MSDERICSEGHVIDVGRETCSRCNGRAVNVPETITESEAAEAEATAVTKDEAEAQGVDTEKAEAQAIPVDVVPDPKDDGASSASSDEAPNEPEKAEEPLG